ncbi:C40 family peptidase [Corynebacterium halotolerans]|uniref:Cell wall-associated hydrolase n=1 Tax=Corynebacterium halotolerans YIM 70093 = DSM 44683 TaxID=1121362 RepID=M1P8D0_9CORY|nr:C40 family peptidase [Corynebacterium halotolerans]AGF72921.1 cell wall-associated hydrolase [Corynebacterium halotolerans YIM 70093 = DSM 44683]
MRFPLGSPGRLTRAGVAAALGVALLTTSTTLTPAPVVHAQEIDTLIATMEEVSREASAKNEEVKQLELDIEAGLADLAVLRDDAEAARVRAEEVRAAEHVHQAEVDDVAGAKYRGLLVDPVVNALAAENPQNAIDRISYLETLTRNTERAVVQLAEATALAGKAHTDASRAVAEAAFQQSELERKRAELDAERDDLEERIRQIEERVNGLSEADQLRWLEKNGPLPADLDGVTGPESGMAAVRAALGKLGSPYGWGATGPHTFDCSGLMVWAYQQQGKAIPRTSQAQLAGGTPVSRAELQPGDIVGYYPGVTHVGMYIGNGQLVHASDYGIPVQVVSVDSMPWAGAVRY